MDEEEEKRKMVRFKFPSYWMLNESCIECGRPVGKLVRWLHAEKKYAVRMVQPHCTHIDDQSKFRTVTQGDVDEYLKRYNAGEKTQ
jgi:hypothetical protein